jgi:hypothetical protein
MTDLSDLNLLRARILRFFMEDGAKQASEFTTLPGDDRRFVRELIYSMAQAGLLERWGRTKGIYLHTSRLGFVVLVTLEHEYLDHNRPGLPE